jgi:hypothetical protein
MSIKKEILRYLDEEVAARYLEGSRFIKHACEIADDLKDDCLLEALLIEALLELKEAAYDVAISKACLAQHELFKDRSATHRVTLSQESIQQRTLDQSRIANYRACLRAYRAALFVAYAKKDLELVYKLSRMMDWHHPDDILEVVANNIVKEVQK